MFQVPQPSASYYYLDDLQLSQNAQIATDPVYMEVADDLNIAAWPRAKRPTKSGKQQSHLTHEDSGFTEEGSDVTSSAGSRGNRREGLATSKRMK